LAAHTDTVRSQKNARHDPSWYVRDPAELIWASWNESYVAYHRPSGKTHFLNAASYELLTELLREPRDIETIATEFSPAESEDEVASARNRDQLAALLNQLEQLGLIRRA